MFPNGDHDHDRDHDHDPNHNGHAQVLAFLLCYVLSLVKQRMKMQHLADSAINGYEKLRP